MCIPSQKIAIEYDGWYYHSSKDSINRERKKDNILEVNNFYIIRIKEVKENTNNITFKNNVIKYHLQENYRNLDELIKYLIVIIEKKTKRDLKADINHKRDYQKIEDIYYHIRKSNTLAVKFPKISNEWSNNNKILPDTINSRSAYKAKWICKKCNREYESTVNNRVNHNAGCPFCANKKVCEANSLMNLFPDIAKEWNYEKNGKLTPNDVTSGSDKKVWWKCKKGHEWKTNIYARTGKNKTKCPYCSHRLLAQENSLQRRNPELTEIWNCEKNTDKTPNDFSYSSNKEVWWKCKNGHEWVKSINRMQRIKSKEKCPYCRKNMQ